MRFREENAGRCCCRRGRVGEREREREKVCFIWGGKKTPSRKQSVNTQAATTVISFNTLGASPGPASPETVAGEAALEDLYFRI